MDIFEHQSSSGFVITIEGIPPGIIFFRPYFGFTVKSRCDPINCFHSGQNLKLTSSMTLYRASLLYVVKSIVPFQ